jgi:hypothetical protein
VKTFYAWLSRALNPGYNMCKHCGVSWAWVKGHHTHYTYWDVWETWPLIEYAVNAAVSLRGFR